MKQRVMIAAALALTPPLLVLDEPTTALDVTVQYEILLLIRALREELKMGLILVSHDLAVVEFLCERIMTMYAGASVEIGAAAGHAQPAAPPLHRRAAALAAGARGARRRPGRDPGRVAGRRVVAGGLPLLAALPARDRRLQGRSPAARCASSRVT